MFESTREDTNEDGVIDAEDGVHIYSLDLATGNLLQLTTGHHYDLAPTWSPDGNRIAFISNRDGNQELYTMSADGSDVTRLTETPENEESPDWSPDGARIAYALVHLLENGIAERDLMLIDLATNTIEPMIIGPTDDDQPSWSPDGRFIAFERREDREREGIHSYEHSVHLLEVDSMKTTKLTQPETQVDNPAWLPVSGHFLAMAHTPGDLSSSSVRVFEVEWDDGNPALRQVFTIEDAPGGTWGANGEWFFSIDFIRLPESAPQSSYNNWELIVAPVDFSTQTYPPSPLGGFHIFYLSEEGELLTDNLFYDAAPDWHP